MANRIYRPNLDEDVYVVWDTISSSPWCIGSKEDVIEAVIESELRWAREEIKARTLWNVDRAEERGISPGLGEMNPQVGNYGTLPAEKMVEFAYLWIDGEEDMALEMVVPFEYDEGLDI